MATTLGFFEDDFITRFLPLTWTRPVYGLRCGIDCLWEKGLRAYGVQNARFLARPLVAEVWSESLETPVNQPEPGLTLWLNGRVVADPDLAMQIPLDGDENLYVHDGVVVAARVQGHRLQDAIPSSGMWSRADWPDLPIQTVSARLASYPWDLIDWAGEEIARDMQSRGKPALRGVVHPGAQLIRPEAIHVGEGAAIGAGAVLDASGGPIWVGAGTTVEPLSMIFGPVALGEGCRVKAGARIYGPVAAGPVCKLCGEVEGSIIQGRSNKQHEGFLGHAYLGEWINLGAGTNNSDLKNNYGSIRVRIGGEVVDTGRQFLGLIMGDHSKSAIATRFNTGTVCGAFANVFATGFPPRNIPDFAWMGDRPKVTRLADALDMGRRVMARRSIELSPAYEKMVRAIFALSHPGTKE